jgi:outer membrane autotransporter protein
VDQRRRAYNDGYDADGYGFAVGADTPFDGGASLIGAAFAYGQTSADGDGVNRTSTDVDSYQLVLYGDRLFENRAYAKGMLGYGWHANDVARHDVGGTPGPTLASSYDAWQITARAEAGRPYMVDRKLTLIPHLTANYAYYDAEAYSEAFAATGEVPLGGTLALDVAPESLESFRLGLGVLARWDVEVGADALLQPELRLNYRHEFIGDRFETTSEFVGAPGLASFRTLGVDPPRDILDVGVGALLSSAGGIDVRASYDLELKDSYTAHGGYLRASVSF